MQIHPGYFATLSGTKVANLDSECIYRGDTSMIDLWLSTPPLPLPHAQAVGFSSLRYGGFIAPGVRSEMQPGCELRGLE